ncbi:hypothetical protein R6Z07F_010191 [Ovis aries]
MAEACLAVATARTRAWKDGFPPFQEEGGEGLAGPGLKACRENSREQEENGAARSSHPLTMPRRIRVSFLQEEPRAGAFEWLLPPLLVLFPPPVQGAETGEQGDLPGSEASVMCQHPISSSAYQLNRIHQKSTKAGGHTRRWSREALSQFLLSGDW